MSIATGGQTPGVEANRSDQKLHWIALALFVLYFLLYLYPLGNRPLMIPDETRYAEVPREMLASGNWVTPRLNSLRYFEKPPLGYWFNAISLSLFGENAFAVRLPSALAAGLTSLLVYLFGLKMLHSRRTAWLAALIHMTFLEVYFVGTFNILDSLLALFLTAGIMAYFLAVKYQGSKKAWIYWTLSGISLGLAFLDKGFLALAIPVLVLLPWLIWQGQWRALLVYGWYVVLLALLVALPWSLQVYFQEKDFWHYFFWVEHIKRFTSENAQHKAPFYYFVVLLPVLAFPWFSLSFAALAGLRNSLKKTDLVGFLWLWLILPFLFFSLSSGKLATYILPCFPPLAMLLAIGLTRYFKNENTPLFNYGLFFNLLVLILLLAGLVISQLFDVGFSVYRHGEVPQFLLMLFAIGAALFAGLFSIKSTVKKRPVLRLALTSLLILPAVVFMQFASPQVLVESKAPGRFLLQMQDKIKKDTLIVSDTAMIQAVNWYLKRDDVYLSGRGELAYGLGYPDASGRLLDGASFVNLMQNRQGRTVAVFCRKRCPERIRNIFPENSQEYVQGKFHMWLIP